MYIQLLLLAALAVLCALCGYLVGARHRDRRYKEVIDQYLCAEALLYDHVRGHVVREKDFTWADGYPPFVTIGIKEDGSLMSDDEWARHWTQARKMAGLEGGE